MKVGVLALQGGFIEHELILQSLEYQTSQVRTVDDLLQVSHLVIPGGESTVIAKFLEAFGLDLVIKERFLNDQLKIFGTCAGAILLAREVSQETRFKPMNLIDVTIERNAYGSQIASFTKDLLFQGTSVKSMFIRAPKITRCGETVKSLIVDQGSPVLVESQNILLATFHPELVAENAIHRYFMQCV